VPRTRDERGLLLSSPLALLSAGAVVLAGAAFVATNGSSEQAQTPRAAAVTSTPAPTRTAGTGRPQVVEKKRQQKKRAPRPAVRRGETYVEVYNNSGISGLAGSTAARAAGAGWQVVGSDNWYGTIPASTVYYPPRLHAAAELLGKDLGIDRLKPSIAPMRGDRLTVILTRDYS
jgi:LytR cell envelope-related transcriptional attenuator